MLEPDRTLARERELVAAAARRLAGAGLVIGSAGNLSLRAGDRVAVTPTGAALSELAPDQVAVVDLDGAQHAGELAPTSELRLHLGVYRRFGSGAVVHTHAPFATAVACVLDELPVVHYGLMALGGPVRVAPYANFGSSALAEATLAALHDRTAALLANHGTVSHGDDIDQAVEHTLLLEWGCQLYWRAAVLGTPRALDEAEQAAVLAALREYGTTKGRETPQI